MPQRFKSFKAKAKANKSAKPLRDQVAETRSKVAKLYSQIEHKYDTTRISAANLDSGSPLTYSLTSLAEGDTSNSREGLKVHVEYLSYNMLFSMNSSNSTEWARVLIVRDTQQIGDTSPGMTDVLDTSTVGVSVANRSRYQQGRFVIHLDRLVLMNSDRPQQLLRGVIRCPKSIQTFYNGSNSTDIQKNGYYLMITGADNVTYGTVKISVNTRFSDL